MQIMSFDSNQYEMEMMFVKVRPSLATIISNRATEHQTIEDQTTVEFEQHQQQQQQIPSQIRWNPIKQQQQQKSNNHIEWRFDDDDHDDNSDSITFIRQNDVKNSETIPKIIIHTNKNTSNNRKSFHFGIDTI